MTENKTKEKEQAGGFVCECECVNGCKEAYLLTTDSCGEQGFVFDNKIQRFVFTKEKVYMGCERHLYCNICNQPIESYELDKLDYSTRKKISKTDLSTIKFSGKYEIERYTNKRIRGGVLFGDTEICGIHYQANNWVWFYENGQVWKGRLGISTTIGGRLYKGKHAIQFYDDGRVESGWLEENTTIGSMVYEGGSLIELYHDGTVFRGVLVKQSVRF